MEDLHLEPQKKTLDIKCVDGSISMFGNSLLPNPRKFFQPVFDWVTEYVKNPSKKTEVTLKFEYIDTASTQSLYQILRQLNGVRTNDFVLMVNWYIEDADPEMQELGEMIEQRMGIEFQYVPY